MDKIKTEFQENKAKYFVAKVNNFAALIKCITDQQWACKNRQNPPHPLDILAEAFSSSKVYIIYSVINNHGWHGFAEMTSTPAPQKDGTFSTDLSEKDATKSAPESGNSPWHYFSVKWHVNFTDFGEQCLTSKLTEALICSDGEHTMSVNKCRNWQELDTQTGEKICHLISAFREELVEKQSKKENKKMEQAPQPFYEDTTESIVETWNRIVSKVEVELGRVILACPFGSQRYNLQTANSDTDMFIVYQAKTSDMLGFHPPKQTIKNSEGQLCDYTIHEVHRYCELLLAGDARCVETLFLDDHSLIRALPVWRQLADGKQLFLNKACLDKYLRDAHGSKGTKLLLSWCAEHEKDNCPLSPKMCKLLYIIVRLLQNARELVAGHTLQVYRPDDSQERRELMAIRAGSIPIQQARDIVNKYVGLIEAGHDCVADNREEVERYLTHWLLTLRHADFNL